MAKDVVNESSAMTIEARFTARNNAPVTPISVRYRVKDLTNDRVVTDWVDVTPASEVFFEITAEENNVYDDDSRRLNYFEERVVAVQANYGTDSQYADEYRYLIKNLRGFDS
jgi:hypothetical protein